ncbi:MAG TPA: alpha/beta hydrolase [Tepidisphaeraceae bacterium]|nr:alpha/beta hydrolase [Tepidisphaeraceae bacterium]
MFPAPGAVFGYNGRDPMLYVYPIVSRVYALIPVVAFVVVIVVSRRTGKRRPIRTMLRTGTLGAFLGGAVATLHATVSGGPVSIQQIFIAGYLGVAAMCVVAGINWLLYRLVSRVFRINPRTGEGRRSRWPQVGAGVVQAVLLIGIGLPYLGSVLFLYRPKSVAPGNPLTLIDASYDVVHFRATDGIRLEGWWIPATHNEHSDHRGEDKQGHATVLLCHGFGTDKASQLFLARDLVANGYNVLAIDLRDHGRSGGQFTGLGAVESRDVLGAVHWLRTARADESRRILGLGESLGAVALIEAAADQGPDGQAIDAIAAYNPYSDLPDVLNDVAADHTIQVGRWALTHLIVPVASVQLGKNLRRVSPDTAVRMLWPRPILVLGNSTAHHVPLRGSFELFRSALQPKYGYWRDDADRDALLHDDTAALTVRIFFDEEKSIL